MARLRAENEQEEQKLSGMHAADGGSGPASAHVSAKDAIIEVDEEEIEGLDEEEQMQKMLGFGGFDSTKGKAVEDNHKSLAKGSAAKNKARKYRQYMNRKGGFNKPLDKMN
jgi:U4/U6.U5 tri-snRNP-associated protein 3